MRQLLKNRETHGGIVRDGRYANISRQTANVTLHMSYAGWLREGSFEWNKSRNAHFLLQHPPYVVYFAGSVKVDIKNLWEIKKKGVIKFPEKKRAISLKCA